MSCHFCFEFLGSVIKSKTNQEIFINILGAVRYPSTIIFLPLNTRARFGEKSDLTRKKMINHKKKIRKLLSLAIKTL